MTTDGTTASDAKKAAAITAAGAFAVALAAVFGLNLQVVPDGHVVVDKSEVGVALPDGAIVVTEPEVVAILGLDEWAAITDPDDIASLENGWARFYGDRKVALVADVAEWCYTGAKASPVHDSIAYVTRDHMNRLWRNSDEMGVPTDTLSIGQDAWFLTVADQPLGMIVVRE